MMGRVPVTGVVGSPVKVAVRVGVPSRVGRGDGVEVAGVVPVDL